MSIKLIINADDFGSSSSVNAAIARAHTQGILTSTSLMVTGEGVQEAVSIARDNPSLAVGLHLALSNASSSLPPYKIPSLVDSQSFFLNSPIRAAFRYYFSKKARHELASEIEAQFEKFALLGLPLSHIDGHQHLHAHPSVIQTVIRLAEKYGAHGIRMPREPLFMNLSVDASHPTIKTAVCMGHAYLARVCRKSLVNSALVRCDICIGGAMSGRMNDDYVIGMLRRIRADSLEVYFHPSTGPMNEPYGPNPGDLEALLSHRLRAYVNVNCKLTTYAGLMEATD